MVMVPPCSSSSHLGGAGRMSCCLRFRRKKEWSSVICDEKACQIVHKHLLHTRVVSRKKAAVRLPLCRNGPVATSHVLRQSLVQWCECISPQVPRASWYPTWKIFRGFEFCFNVEDIPEIFGQAAHLVYTCLSLVVSRNGVMKNYRRLRLRNRRVCSKVLYNSA
eukprot:g74141.t1